MCGAQLDQGRNCNTTVEQTFVHTSNINVIQRNVHKNTKKPASDVTYIIYNFILGAFIMKIDKNASLSFAMSVCLQVLLSFILLSHNMKTVELILGGGGKWRSLLVCPACITLFPEEHQKLAITK